jgi:PEP-CTERM motif-containing protein
MKLRVTFLLLLTLLCLMTAISASAGSSYSNGPLNGNYDAWTINFGYIVSDSFTISFPTTATGFDFYTWSFPGDIPLSVDWSITTLENGGSTLGSGIGATLYNTIISTNSYGYQINYDQVSGLNVSMPAGTHWLNLQNAAVANGDPVYWDENDGPSLASDNAIGTIGSEAFGILGSCGTDCGPTPEPSSILLFGSGIVGLAGILRRKLS